tara:strand:- start:1601 stop:2209 length:609 start_codon:yes stop_codon:yes gene_type:complete
MEKSYNIKDFIGVFDNFIPPQECDDLIKMYDDNEKLNKTYTRLTSEHRGSHSKKDAALSVNCHDKDKLILSPEIKTVIINFDVALKQYMANTDIKEFHPEFQYTTLKIQKTLPKEGYHVWHTEWGPGLGMEGLQRALVFSIYLNDVEDGGETEFLHFSQRVKPKKGRLVIWPAHFPYVHRGNPPLSGEKYMLTSWLLINPYA